ncbi:MAG TPA: ribosome-associated translation inhibitor RaiA [Candidatus Saccharimonadales bacterium]|nr:ribosome-associated translation inhibitor RaiA [Candidatus Saccharimonadales bacterium]
MIQQLEISGIHMEVGDDLRKYAGKKIGSLDRFVPRAARQSMHAHVQLKELKQKGAKECVCEVTITLPQETLNVTEGTVNIFAAVDIAETKLRAQLRKYKELHDNPRLHRRLLLRFRRKPA